MQLKTVKIHTADTGKIGNTEYAIPVKHTRTDYEYEMNSCSAEMNEQLVIDLSITE
jgi:hypothetical protein